MKFVVIVLFALFVSIAPSAAEECVPPDVAVKKLHAGGFKTTKTIGGAKATEVAAKLGAPYKVSHLILIVTGDELLIAAFRDGCFVEIVRGSIERFKQLAPGVL